MQPIILVLSLWLVGVSPAFATCETELLAEGVTDKLWREAIDAETQLFALHLTARSIVHNHLQHNQVYLNFPGPRQPQINLEAFKSLVLAQAENACDQYHFGVKMHLPTFNFVTQEGLSVLAAQVSPEVPVEMILQASFNLALQSLEDNLQMQSQLYKQAMSWVSVNYKSQLAVIQKENKWSHEKLYEFKHDIIEITNYTSKLLRQVEGVASNAGFLAELDMPNPAQKKSIGFIND